MKPPINVLHVLKYFRPAFTGEGIFVERLTPVMDTIAPNVAHDMLAIETPRPASTPPVASTLRRIVYLSEGQMPNWRRELLLLWWLARNLHRYQVVHCHTHIDRHFIAYLFVKIFHRRLVLSSTLDDSLPGLLGTYKAANRPYVSRLFRLFDALISISPKLKAESDRLVPPERVHLVPIGIGIPELTMQRRDAMRVKYGIGPGEMAMIFVGGICDRKDPLFLVEQLPAILEFRPGTKLVIVGPVLEAEHYRRMTDTIRDNHLENQVVFVGEVDDPYPFLEMADMMAFASHLEGFGTAVIEAMAHGLPVVVRHLPGVNDSFVEHGETGFLFTNANEFNDAVRQLAESPALRDRIGAAARAVVTDKFDIVAIATRYLSIYGSAPQADMASADGAGTVHGFDRAAATLTASSSVIDRRFRSAVELPPDQRPLLVTTVDAEEDFDWSRPLSRSAHDVSSMAQQHLAHRIFDHYRVVPTYLVDFPVASQAQGYETLLDFVRDGRCEIGAQLHPWVNPPFIETVTVANSFAGNLPLGLEFEKLRILTETIEQGFGVRPQVYRAGRYGVGRRTGDVLKRLGYLVDSSVVPERSFADQAGPNFFGFPTAPYWIDGDRTMLELPVSSAFVGPFSPGPRLARVIYGTTSNRRIAPALLARSGLVDRVKLTPEGITVDEAKKLIKALLDKGSRIFVLSYHSPSLLPGKTPYVRTSADLDRLLQWLDTIYEFFLGELGGLAATPRSVYDLTYSWEHRADSNIPLSRRDSHFDLAAAP